MDTLLIADDEQPFLDLMVRILQKDHNLLIARNWNEVMEKFESSVWRLNAAILDVNMPGISVDPFTIVERLLTSNPTVPMIIMSGQGVILRQEFLKLGVFQYYGKPIDMIDLKQSIKSALAYNRSLRKLENYEKKDKESAKYFRELHNIDFKEVNERIEAQDTETHKVPILIHNEPGCQPSRVARIIHQDSGGKLFFEKVCNESLRNILPHNCQNGDTLFLDGIDCLGNNEKAFLLSILDDASSSNGSQSDQFPAFRLIASVDRNVANDALNNGDSNFARLLTKLAEVEVRIDPLRLRKHDLRKVITTVFERKKKEHFSRAEELSEEIQELLTEHNWPLNFDELEMILECLLLTCQDSVILQKHLHQLDFSDIAFSKYPTLDDMVDEHIKKALRLTLGNKSRAAKMLGITPKTLYSRIRN